MRAILLAAVLGLAVGLFSLGNSSGMGAGYQLPCTVIVQPGESIQAAIDKAEEGAVICLAEGTWEENLVIGKGLTLRGLGPEKSVIKGVKEGEPVILISSNTEIEVIVEGLTIAEAKGLGCAESPLRCPNGLSLGGKVKATISGNAISGNRWPGIKMWGSAQATIQGNTISENRWDGISMRDSAQATIQGNTISGNRWDGISMGGSAQATISGNTISGSRYGISMWDSAQATIENNTIQEHKECGIWSSSDNPAQGKGNRMRGNGADLCGNAPASLRIPLVPPTTKTQLSFPGPYPTLQEAIDALAPGGVITIAAGEHKAGLTIWKPLTLRGAGREEVKFMGAVSLISEAQEVQIEGVTITGSAFTGLLLGGQAKATITNSQILGNKGSGIGMRDSAQATISSSQTSSNEGDGISMWGSAQATITNSQISGNKWDGIFMWGSAQAEIRASTIEGNGTSENCKKDDYICNGIELHWKPQVKIIDSTIRNNADWGVGAVLTQCGYKFDEFTGAVTFEDMMLDQIAGNNTSGNQNGMGNPGNHYWNRPDIPDGQVCLP